MVRRFSRILLLVVPPLAFVLKDVIATIAVIAAEPGISTKAARYYSIAMLPGPLFVESWVMLFNFIFGALVGVILYLCVKFKKIWLLIVPPSAFLLKDIIALTIAVLFTGPEITPKAGRYYSIVMLPGSLFHEMGDPMLFNVLFGSLLGLIFYLYFTRRRPAVSG